MRKKHIKITLKVIYAIISLICLFIGIDWGFNIFGLITNKMVIVPITMVMNVINISIIISLIITFAVFYLLDFYNKLPD